MTREILTPAMMASLDAAHGTDVVLPAATYFYTNSPNATSTNNALGNGTMRLSPWLVRRPISLARLGAEITTAGEAGSALRLVIYADNGSGFPGALVVDAGTINGASVGVQEVTVNVTLQPGLYWVGGAVQNAPTTQPGVRTIANLTPPVVIGLGQTLPSAAGTVVGYAGAASGAAPSTFPIGNPGSGFAPRIIARNI
jgi:hypothetical protein